MTYENFLQFLANFRQIKSFKGKIDYASKNLQRIGSGSGRMVFDIDGTKVFKLAKNPKGVAQNEAEEQASRYDDYDDILTKVFESDDDGMWLVSEKAKKVSEKRFKQITGFDIQDVYIYLRNHKDLNLGKRSVFGQNAEVKDALDNDEEFTQRIGNFIMDYSQSAGDMGRASTYGEVIRGGIPAIVLTDYGLSDEVYDTHYAPKPQRMYELFGFEDGNDDILSDIGNVGEVRHNMWALVPQGVGDGDEPMNEEFISYVSNRDKYPKTQISNLPFLADRFHECVNNLKETLKVVPNKKQFYNNLLELQNYLVSQNYYSREQLDKEEYSINEADVPAVQRDTLTDKAYATELATTVAQKLGLSQPNIMGGGANGFAFKVNENLVMKLTADISEADAAAKLLRNRPKYIAIVFNLYKVVDTEKNLAFYVIMQENVNDKPLEKFRKFDDDISAIEPQGMQYADIMMSIKRPNRFNYDAAIELAKHILTDKPEANVSEPDRQAAYEFMVGMINIRAELLNLEIKSTDYITIGNLGYKDGVLKFFDTGGYIAPEPEMGDSNIIYVPEGVTEEVINEVYPKDVADTIANQIARKVGAKSLTYIKGGNFGVAYDIGDNRVLKITKDKSEATENLSLMGKTLKHIAEPYGVYVITSKANDIPETYAIVLEKLKTDEVRFKAIVDRLNFAFEKIMGVRLPDVIDHYVHGYQYDDGVDENKIKKYMSKNPDDSAYFNALMAIGEECKKYGVESIDYINYENLGYKKDGTIGFFDVGFGNYFSKSNNVPQEIEIDEDATSLYSAVDYVGQDGNPTYNNMDTTPPQDNNIPTSIDERIITSMKGSSTVNVKKKCRLGGGTTCNQGDINNFEIKSLTETVNVNFPDGEIAGGIDWYNITDNGEHVGEIELSSRGKYLTLGKIFIAKPFRGKGYANDAMKLLFAYADKTNKTIVLTPDDVWGANKSKLKTWYKSLGFLENRGKNKDFETMQGMYRPPKGSVSEEVNMEKLERGVDKGSMLRIKNFPLKNLTVSKRGMQGAIQDIKQGRPSKTNSPALIFYNIQNKTFLVEDGYHRVAQAFLNKEKTISVKIYSDNWSDYVANISPENKFVLAEEIDASEAHTDEGSLQAMLDNRKDVGIIILGIQPELKRIAIENDFGIIPIKQTDHNLGTSIVYRKSPRGIANAKRLLEIMNSHGGYVQDKSAEEAREIGKLLDYSDSSIEIYVRKKYGSVPAEKTVSDYAELDENESQEIKFTNDEILNKFLNRLNTKTRLMRNPFMPREFVYGEKGSLEFSRFDKQDRNEVELQDIMAFEKNKGIGSSMMRDICDVADELGIKLTLTAKPFGNDPNKLEIRDLIKFYEKFGFVEEPNEFDNDEEDFQYQWDDGEEQEEYEIESMEMSRDPQTPRNGGNGIDEDVDGEGKLNENFWKWFGNSKIKNPDGTPMRVYHGTKSDFGEFSHDKIGSQNDYGFMGAGFYFMIDKEWSNGYAEYSDGDTPIGNPSVMPVYLKMENPFYISDYKELPSQSEKYWGDKEKAFAITNTLKGKGYDGVVLDNYEFVVFEPTQIKSATGNNGDYNPSKPEITHEGVGDAYAEKEFNIPNPDANFQAKINKNDNIENKEEIIGDDGGMRVIKNPKTLNNVGLNVRGVIDKDGNLYVEETNEHVHEEILMLLEKRGILKRNPEWQKMPPTDYITVIRFGKSNNFWIGTSHNTLYKIKDRTIQTWERDTTRWDNVIGREEALPLFQQFMDKAKQINPQYNFINELIDYVMQPDVDEGVADKYAEKEFNVPDPNVDMDVRARAEMEMSMNGKPVASVKGVPIFKNPQYLANFDKNVRAIADKEGNLYVAQQDNDFYHGSMGHVLKFAGPSEIYIKQDEYQLLHRVGNTNSFGLGDTGTNYVMRNADTYKKAIQILQAAKRRNPHYDFYEERFDSIEGEPISLDNSVDNLSEELDKRHVISNFINKQIERTKLPVQFKDVFVYTIKLDEFIHFTTLETAKKIIKDNKLIGESIWGVSTVYGLNLPEVQQTHIKGDKIVALKFTTNSVPERGFTEEVVWHDNVIFNNVSVIPTSIAAKLINRSRSQEQLNIKKYLKDNSSDSFVLYLEHPNFEELYRTSIESNKKKMNMNETEIMSIQALPFKQEIEELGGKIYSVGGAVRDEFLGKQSKDLDIIITGVPFDELERVLGRYGRVDSVGKSFGVLKFKPRGATEDIDIVIPRTERPTGEKGHQAFDVTSDHTLPIEKDLERRDFTINALAKDMDGNIIDPFHGVDDLKNKIIRVVNPEAFSDDPLRMLRAVQFASRFGFNIEPKTMQMIHDNAGRIKEIPSERILTEFDKIVKKGNAFTGAFLLKRSGLTQEIFGNDSGLYVDKDAWSNVKTMGEFIWLLSHHLVENAAEFYLKTLKGDIDTYKEIKGLMMAFENGKETNIIVARTIAHNMYLTSPQSLKSQIIPNVIKNAASELLSGKYPKTVNELSVNGNDLMQAGLSGREIGDTQKSLLLKIYSDQASNNKEELLGLIRGKNEMIKEEKKTERIEFGCLMLYLDVPIWERITSIIMENDLYRKEGYGIEEEPHTTILYGFHDEVTADMVFDLYKEKMELVPLEIGISGISIFENPEFDVVKFDVNSEVLNKLNAIMRKLPNTSNFPTYHAHITIAYVNKGEGKKYIKKFEKDRMLSGSELVYTWKGHKGKEGGKVLMLKDKEMNENNVPKVLYSAIVLNDESKAKLLKVFGGMIPEDWKKYAHHMTLNMGAIDPKYKNDLGKEIELSVVDYGKDDNVMAVGVEGYSTNNKKAHITLAVNVNGGGKPMMSNNLTEWRLFGFPLKITGTITEVKAQ